MEEALKNEMELEYCRRVGSCAGTNQSIIVETDRGRMFVKICENLELAEGEMESLKFIRQTGAIRCPAPFCTIKFGAQPIKYGLVTEYLEMENSGRMRNETKLAEQIARMHNFKFPEAENQFGFRVATCCGKLPQENAWCATWREFFTKNRLAPKLEGVCCGAQLDALLGKTWKLLECRNTITPSLVHGDLWSGNWAMFENEPVIFDPASSFSDPEFEFGIMSLFGGVSREFRAKYFELVDFMPGFENRLLLYELYHLLNHFQHFGGSYKISAQRKIAEILRI